MSSRVQVYHDLPWAEVLAYFERIHDYAESLRMVDRLLGDFGIWSKFARIRAKLRADRDRAGGESFLLPILLIDGERTESLLGGTGFLEEFRNSDSDGFIKVVNPFTGEFQPIPGKISR